MLIQEIDPVKPPLHDKRSQLWVRARYPIILSLFFQTKTIETPLAPTCVSGHNNDDDDDDDGSI